MALRHISTVSSSVNHDSKKQTLVLRVQEQFLDHNCHNKFPFHPTLLILSKKKIRDLDLWPHLDTDRKLLITELVANGAEIEQETLFNTLLKFKIEARNKVFSGGSG